MGRDYQKLKTLEDYSTLDAPIEIDGIAGPYPEKWPEQYVLRMLVRPKYGRFLIPKALDWLAGSIITASLTDKEITGIMASWCYVTVRHGPVQTVTDDEWHFDGSSFRTDIIPERNYCWVSSTPIQYKHAELKFPKDFDPLKHNLFTYAAEQLADSPTLETEAKRWYLLNPFCLHRRNPNLESNFRTFIRICFTDIEGRDINNTPNPLLPTPFFGRDPVKTFRNNLQRYRSQDEGSL